MDYREIRSPPIPPRPSSSEAVRSDPDQDLYEEIFVLLDHQDAGDDCAGKGKRFSCSSLMESDADLFVKSGLLPGWDHVFDQEQQEDHDQCRRFAPTVQQIRSGVQLYQQVLFLRGTNMMNFITQLNCIADELDKTLKKTRIAGITGGTTGAIGTAAVVAGMALAPVTFGASLAMAGIGVGVAAAGGVTGASAAISKKVRKTQNRRKVEKILRSYQSQMEDVEECLKFIITGMEHLRRLEPAVDTDAADVMMLAERLVNSDIIGALSENTRAVQAFTADLDSYFTKDDTQRLKKGSESLFAAKIREVALKLKENIDQLIRIKNMFMC
ncbi:apolipoprotein L6-like isoform X2 [Carassius auratus]|nr:apolipoprotein L6-like isoform X2 [Carassius auratus]